MTEPPQMETAGVPKTFTPIGKGLSVNRVLHQEDKETRERILAQIKKEGFFHGENMEAYMLPAIVWHLPTGVRHLVANELGIPKQKVFIEGFEITAELPENPGKHLPVFFDLDSRGLKVVLEQERTIDR
ncbi:hypothetical protein [Dictyobacter formicarum]|uniref:Uncharacterized protein n=1 Tax=Dictyobacter formicarum TaxID=2778368 RepID=A0ABQ3VII7_9CHLR|nr:hypothetical protein [Dictyobacter formicarum]GHO85188.1 hypothetical protein KSZ_31940 [Dictyobacter formicarum]